MRAGDLVFVRGNGFVSRAIRQITGGHWNHVMIFVGEGVCVSADNPRVHFAKIADYEARGEQVGFGRVLSRTDPEAAMVANKAISLIDKEYDNRGLLGIWFKFAFKWIGIPGVVFWGSNKADDQKRFWCSELVGHVWGEVGVKFTDENISWLTPSQIFESPLIGQIEA